MTRDPTLTYRLDDLLDDPGAFYRPPDDDAAEEAQEEARPRRRRRRRRRTCPYCGTPYRGDSCPFCREERRLMRDTSLPEIHEIVMEQFAEELFRAYHEEHRYDDYHGVMDD